MKVLCLALPAIMMGVMLVNCSSSDDIELGEEFHLTIGQRIEIADTSLEIVFTGVTGDSRCPKDVVCVQQGEVNVEVEFIDDDGSRLLSMTQPGLFYNYSKSYYAGYEINPCFEN